jgi:hypothetical protein
MAIFSPLAAAKARLVESAAEAAISALLRGDGALVFRVLMRAFPQTE